MAIRGKAKKAHLTALLVVCMCLAAFCSACGSTQENGDASQGAARTATKKEQVRVLLVDCPAAMGFTSFMQAVDEGGEDLAYDYRIATAASYETVVDAFEAGDVDIALTYPRSAVSIYRDTEGAVAVADIASLVDSAIVTGSKSIKTIDDIADRDVYLAGPNTPRSYVLRMLLDLEGLTDAVSFTNLSSGAEVTATLSSNRRKVGVLDEPERSAAFIYNHKLHDVVTLLDLWEEQVTDGSLPVNTVVLVSRDFYEDHPEAVRDFVAQHAKSVDKVVSDPHTHASLVASYGFSETEEYAEASIPRSNLVCISGQEMKEALSGYVTMLNGFEPGYFGEAPPSDDFYLTLDESDGATDADAAEGAAEETETEDGAAGSESEQDETA